MELDYSEYIKEMMKKYPNILTQEEEKDLLVKAISQHNDSAREKLLNSNWRLVVKIIHEYQIKSNDLMDLIAAGNLGLVDAYNHFDLTKNLRFSTYASSWVNKYVRDMVNQINQIIKIPEEVLLDYQKMSKLKNEVELLGLDPTPKNCAILCNKVYTEDEFRDYFLNSNTSVISLDVPVDDTEDSNTVMDFIADTSIENPESYANKIERDHILDQMLREILEPEEYQIFNWCILGKGTKDEIPLSYQAAGQLLGITGESVRLKMKNKIIPKLKANTELYKFCIGGLQ